MDSRRCMISTKPLPPLKQLMPIIGTKQTGGKKDMEKNYKSRKKAYTDGYRIIKGRILTDKRNRLQKARTEEQDNVPLFIILTL